MSFANQALCAEYLAKTKELPVKVYPVPTKIDDEVAKLKLNTINVKIDNLTEEQKEYLQDWEMGTT